MVREVVAGQPGPVRDVVVLNAAAALVAYGKPASGRLEADFADELDGPGRQSTQVRRKPSSGSGSRLPTPFADKASVAQALPNGECPERVAGHPGDVGIGVIRHRAGRHDQRPVVKPDQQCRDGVVAAGQPVHRVVHLS